MGGFVCVFCMYQIGGVDDDIYYIYKRNVHM